MAYYPAMLDLRNRAVLFIGGGWETALKVRGLLEAGAQVTLVSPHAHPELEPLLEAGRIVWHRRAYQPADLEGVWLVMSHPVDKAENAAVYAAAEAQGKLCNCVDDPERCNFILPSVLRRGDLIVSFSTSGTAPALGVRLKQRLAAELGEEYTVFLKILRELRFGITAGFSDFETRKNLWYTLVDSDALEWLRQENPVAAKAELETIIAARGEACRTTRCAGCVGKICQAGDSVLAHA